MLIDDLTDGTGPGSSPTITWRSLWHSPHAAVRITISFGPGLSTVKSSMTTSPGTVSSTAAFVVAPLLSTVG